MSAAVDHKQERFSLQPADNVRLANLCGQFDQHLRQIEERLGITIKNRGGDFLLGGEASAVLVGKRLLEELYRQTEKGAVTAESIHLQLQESGLASLADDNSVAVVVQTKRKSITGRGANQNKYLAAIQKYDLNFGVGPAGTGKTYLAVACAVEALEQERVRRIVLVRPAVEAGERLGFLPGDLSQKVDPYLRPIYDALYEMLGFDLVSRLVEKHVIEVAPLAYMRGRSLNESFIILDEAQNTTREQMKMFLTRIGFGARAVVTGDVTQIDLPSAQGSGLRHVLRVLRRVNGIHVTQFDSSDVVRHPLVRRIVDAYAEEEANEKPSRQS